MKKSSILIGVLIVAILALLSYVSYQKFYAKGTDDNNDDENKTSNKVALSYVTISINPEVELALDDKDIVTDVIPINEEADILTSDLDLVGLNVDEATDKIADAAVETGYIDEYSDENAIVVTTSSDNETTRKTLEERIMTQLNAHLESKKVYAVLVAKDLDDTLKAEATSYGISNGKMLLIEELVALNPDLNKTDLAKLSVQDIQKQIKDYVKERHDALKVSLAKAKKEWQTEKQELKQEYIAKINELRANISNEQKEAFKNMTPAQKEEAINNILAAEKEKIKAAIDTVKQELKDEIKQNTQNYNYPIIKNNAETIKQNIKNRIGKIINSRTSNNQ